MTVARLEAEMPVAEFREWLALEALRERAREGGRLDAALDASMAELRRA